MDINPFTITTKAVKVLESSQTLDQHMTARQYTRLAFKALRQSLDAIAKRGNGYNTGVESMLANELRQASKVAHKKFLPAEKYGLFLYPGEDCMDYPLSVGPRSPL